MNEKRLYMTNEWSEDTVFQRLCGFQPSLGWLLVDTSKKLGTIFLDGRYAQSKITPREWRTIRNVPVSGKIESRLPSYLPEKSVLLLQESLPYGIYKDLSRRLPAHLSRIWFDTKDRANKQRVLKSVDDITAIQHACSLAHQIRDRLEPQIASWSVIWKTELQLRWEIIHYAFTLWCEAEAFDTIVATWSHSALPHHHATTTPIWTWPLLIDMWWKVSGWCSDHTRSFYIRESRDQNLDSRNDSVWQPEGTQFFASSWSELFQDRQHIHAIVKQAHDEAIALIRPWIQAKSIAQKARSVIEEAWYGDFYPHSLWHGVGVDVHEAPYLSVRSDHRLQPGMIVTIEPGIYLPGQFWIRHENMLVCTDEWVRIL